MFDAVVNDERVLLCKAFVADEAGERSDPAVHGAQVGHQLVLQVEGFAAQVTRERLVHATDMNHQLVLPAEPFLANLAGERFYLEMHRLLVRQQIRPQSELLLTDGALVRL